MDIQFTKRFAGEAADGKLHSVIHPAHQLGVFLANDKRNWDFLSRFVEEVRGGSPVLGTCCDAILDALKTEAARSMQPVVGEATAKLVSDGVYTPLSPAALKAIFAEANTAGNTPEAHIQCIKKLAQQFAAALRTPMTTYQYGERSITEISLEIFQHEVLVYKEKKGDALPYDMTLALQFLGSLAITVSNAQRTDELPDMQDICTGSNPERFLPDPAKIWSQPDWDLLHKFATQPSITRAAANS